MTIKTIRMTITVNVTNDFDKGQFIHVTEKMQCLRQGIIDALVLRGIVGQCSVDQRVIAEMQPVKP